LYLTSVSWDFDNFIFKEKLKKKRRMNVNKYIDLSRIILKPKGMRDKNFDVWQKAFEVL